MALRFKLFDIPVAVGLDFFLIMLLLGAGWQDPDLLPIWMVVVTVSVFLHEFGHATAAESFGVAPSIQLWGGGGLTMFPRVGPRQHLLIAAAGPATGLVIGGAAAAAAAFSPDLAAQPVVGDLIWVNLGWGLLNLLPLGGLDGGAILSSGLTLVLKRPADTIAAWIGYVVAAAILALLVAVGQVEWALVLGFMVVLTLLRTGVLTGIGGSRSPVNPVELIRAGRYQEAFAIIQSHLSSVPEDMLATALGADTLRLMSDYENSLRGYDAVLARNRADAHALRGRIADLVALGRRAEALRDLEQLAALRTPAGSLSLASAFYALDLHHDGYSLTHSPMGGDATFRRAMDGLASIFEYSTGELDVALAHTDARLAESAGDPEIHELRALILVDMGRFAEARTEALRATNLAPQHPEFKQTLGFVLRMGADPRDAPAALRALVESATARPHGARARGELIAGYVQFGDYVEARAAFETLPGYAREDPFVIYGQAALAVASGQFEESRRLLAAAAEKRPELGIRAQRDPIFAARMATASGR